MPPAKTAPAPTADAAPAVQPRYRVAWECLESGLRSYGDWMDSKASAEAWVAKGNAEWKGVIRHWLETEAPHADR